MMLRSDAHMHTTLCDGKNTPEEMVRAAIAKGFHTMGFSHHTPAPFDESCAGFASEEDCIAEIMRLKELYSDKIAICCGVEQDTYAPACVKGYDYIIGSQHYIKADADGVLYAVDDGAQTLREYIDKYCGGDAYAAVRKFYEDTAHSVAQYRPHIVGHFDLIVKYNADGSFFDEQSAKYKDVALCALDEVLSAISSYGGMVELNTGGMSRGWRDTPYMAEFLLKHAAKKGARMIITSDSHSADTLGAFFEQSAELLRRCGHRSVAVLTADGFKDEKL